jgi:hypothetical protein
LTLVLNVEMHRLSTSVVPVMFAFCAPVWIVCSARQVQSLVHRRYALILSKEPVVRPKVLIEAIMKTTTHEIHIHNTNRCMHTYNCVNCGTGLKSDDPSLKRW